MLCVNTARWFISKIMSLKVDDKVSLKVAIRASYIQWYQTLYLNLSIICPIIATSITGRKILIFFYEKVLIGNNCSCRNFVEMCFRYSYLLMTLRKKWSFPLRISSANVTKSAGSCLIFFVQCFLLMFYLNCFYSHRLIITTKLWWSVDSFVINK